MSTEDLGNKLPQSGSLKRLSKPGGTQPKLASQIVVEQVPDWLQRLLTKYGEKAGRLVGLGEGPIEVEEMPAAVARPAAGGGNLSVLLEQMAEEGISDFPQSQRTSSVEWGNYEAPLSEPPAAPIDDLLANFDPDQTDYEVLPPYGASA